MDRHTYTHVRFHDVIKEVEKKFYVHDGEYNEEEFDADWYDFVCGCGINTGSDSIYFEIDKNAGGLYGLISDVLVAEGFNESEPLYLDIVPWF